MIYSVTRCLVFMTIMYTKPNMPIHAFSAAQVSSAIMWAISYYIFFALYLPAPQELKAQNFPFQTIRDFLPSLKVCDTN
jgi:hypothetical protein